MVLNKLVENQKKERNVIDDEQVSASREIQKRTGKTFYFATLFLPKRVREPTHVLYAFFRIADEVVDTTEERRPEEQRDELEGFKRQALGEEDTDDPVLNAFSNLRDEYSIDDREVEEFISAMIDDIDKSRYSDFDDLRDYMRGSASAVGNMMTAIMEPDEPEKAKPHAEALGEAFQMTNFLRDVREDIVDMERIYLPQTTLEEHGVTEEQIQNLEMSEGFREVMKKELRRTEALYTKGVEGIRYLPRDCQFPVLLASTLYAEHHRLIRKRDYDVLSKTPSLSRTRKIKVFAKTLWHWKRKKDPEAVFYAVSDVSDPTEYRKESKGIEGSIEVT